MADLHLHHWRWRFKKYLKLPLVDKWKALYLSLLHGCYRKPCKVEEEG